MTDKPRLLVDDAERLRAEGRTADSLAAFERAIRAYEGAGDLATRAQVARATLNKGSILEELGYVNEARTTFDELASEFLGDDEPATVDLVVEALYQSGRIQQSAGHEREAMHNYEHVIEIASTSTSQRVGDLRVLAELARADALNGLGQPAHAVAAVESALGDAQAVGRAGVATIARAQAIKAFSLAELGKTEDALSELDLIIDRYGESTDALVRRQVAFALYNKAQTLQELRKTEAAMDVYKTIADRFDPEADCVVREIMLSSWLEIAINLDHGGERRRAVALYDRVLASAPDAPTDEEGRPVARALALKANLIGETSPDEAIVLLDGLIERFGTRQDAELRDQVAIAYFNKATMLERLGRNLEALASYDELLDRAEETVSTRIAEVILLARERIDALDEDGLR
jgi:tetratricopeptide (TPR) repeat protein